MSASDSNLGIQFQDNHPTADSESSSSSIGPDTSGVDDQEKDTLQANITFPGDPRKVLFDPSAVEVPQIAIREPIQVTSPPAAVNTITDIEIMEAAYAAYKKVCYGCNNEWPGGNDHSLKRECPIFIEYIDRGFVHYDRLGTLIWGPANSPDHPVPVLHDSRSGPSLVKLIRLRALQNGWMKPEEDKEMMHFVDIKGEPINTVVDGRTYTVQEYINATEEAQRRRGRPSHKNLDKTKFLGSVNNL
ncbi:hypothetical protein BHYA_0481g00010 [Botrytis hyacinthi]|uniref:Uncharacterized protein n=1 Tax=Botrytis hyacinthi TaxID=278943 RepID=A0A4Z1GC59_9HELO|nr:hypothetical protein BHYA_0481g00010 [Botrytis hyacinthi]